MKAQSAKKAPRNTNVTAMTLRCKASTMKDRRSPRGGASNKQREYLREA